MWGERTEATGRYDDDVGDSSDAVGKLVVVARPKETAADRLYLEQMGADAYARQHAERLRRTTCNCVMKGKAAQYHAPDCPIRAGAYINSGRA